MNTRKESNIKEPNKKEPIIKVGILLKQEKIDFSLLSPFILNGKPIAEGDYSVSVSEGKLVFNGVRFDELAFEADDLHNSVFELKDVIIGVNFHWERRENQRFLGGLKFIVEENAVTAVNGVYLEDYLVSVIASEMSATSSRELLKAHAVISRGWLLAQIQKTRQLENEPSNYQTSFITPSEIVRWYDREDHEHFDVCADDHCQRYQGITRQSTELVNQVILETRGEVVMYNNEICDTRFYKCCGGMMETFENVWEPTVHPYLQGKRDYIAGASILNKTGNSDETSMPDLTVEEEADEWIRSSPPAFCNTKNARVLTQVLNDYDQETDDFYRWKVHYSQEEVASLIKERSGIDYGEIIALEPIERGTSGRITRLKIIGTKQVKIIGKELEIRRTLSPSHLYSSAFVVDTQEGEKGVPSQFTLTGAGWGHGVGLCQIGAAMMADKGFPYREILRHYYPGTDIIQHYK